MFTFNFLCLEDNFENNFKINGIQCMFTHFTMHQCTLSINTKKEFSVHPLD